MRTAQELYGDAADYVNGSFTDEAEAAEAKALRVSCLLNQSQCALKQSEWSEVLQIALPDTLTSARSTYEASQGPLCSPHSSGCLFL